MLLKLNDSKLFSGVINIISELVTEVKIKVDKRGVSITAIDPANVSLVSFFMAKDNFSEFEAENDVLGVNLSDLKAILRRINSGFTIKKNENMLDIIVQDKVVRNFSLALIDLDSEDKEAPKLEYSCKVEINSDLLDSAIQDAAVVADSCILSLGESFVIEAKGSLNKTKTEFSDDECKFKGQGKARYSLEYLQKFMKAAKISAKAVIQFSNDEPLRLDFPDSFLTFILAPRVEED